MLMLLLTIVEIVLHCIGYGLLYIRRAMTLCEAILIIVNIGLMIAISQSWEIRKDYSAIKVLFAVILIIFRLETLHEEWALIGKKNQN